MSKYTSLGRQLGVRGKDHCPRCGANPSHQRWKPHSRATDTSEYEHIDSFNPWDAVICRNCGMGFQVSQLEVDGDYIVDWRTQRDYEPNYCPQCGHPMREGGK